MDGLKAQIADSTHANVSLRDELVKVRQELKDKEHEAEKLTAGSNMKDDQIQNDRARLQEFMSEQKQV